MANRKKKKRNKKQSGRLLWLIAAALVVALALWITVRLTSDPEVQDVLPEEEAAVEQTPETTPETETEQAVPQEEAPLEGKSFPCELEDGKLVVDSLFQFTGFNPDNGGEQGDNIAALLLQNNSSEHLDSAVLTVVLPEGTTAEFHVADLPAGASAMVFAADNTVSETDNLYQEITCEAAFSAESPLLTDKLTVQTDGTAVTLSNYSEETLTNLVVHCHCLMDGDYFGGLTYAYPVESLASGESVTIDAADCYLGEAAVVRIEQKS